MRATSSLGLAAAAAAAALAACTSATAERVHAVQCPPRCASDLDCSLNGACDTGSGACKCDAAWTGACCTSLSLLPVPLASGYRHPNTSTWGGNIVPDPSGAGYHMWIAEMAPQGRGGDPGSGSCGLTTWERNSQVTHVTASQMGGPYTRQEVSLPIWAHNPLVRLINGTYVLYHIGSGSGGAPGDGYCAANATSPCGEQGFDQCNSTCVSVPGYTCAPGYCSGDAGGGADSKGDCGADLAEPQLACDTYAACAPLAAAACKATPGCTAFALSQQWGLGKAKLFSSGSAGLTPNGDWTTWVAGGHDKDVYARARDAGRAAHTLPAPPAPDGSCTLQLHSAASPAGPWVPYTTAVITPCGGNNPGPFVHPNGTLYLLVTDNDMGLYRADSWRGPYTLVASGTCGGGEDPSLYIDTAGRWHCLFHQSPFSNPDIAIGHAYSLDGLQWFVSALPAANSTIEYEGLGAVVHGKRERPHLYMDPATGAVQAFVSGVCITPACDPLDGGGRVDPAADCSSAAQYHNCDANSPAGWYDRTYTLVQRVATAGGAA